MIVNLFAMPGDMERVAVATISDEAVQVGDVIKTDEHGTGHTRWRVIGLHSGEADAVACT